MVIDLHSHYFPRDILCGWPDAPVEIAELSGGTYRFTTGGHAYELDGALFDLERQRADLRRQGLDRRALMAPPFALMYELPRDQGVRWSRALNDGITTAVRAFPDDFVGFATVPLQDVDAAIHELDRAVNGLGLKGIEILTSVAGLGLDAPTLDPFWAKAEGLRLPILIHPHDVAGAQRMRNYHLRNLIGNPTETALAGARLLFGGVLERFSDIRIILSHGGGALPQLVGRLGRGFEVRPECRQRAADPVGNLKRLYFDTVVFDGLALRHLVERVGASQVVLGTDYPFDMGEERPTAFVRDADLPESDAEAILDRGERLVRDVAARGRRRPPSDAAITAR